MGAGASLLLIFALQAADADLPVSLERIRAALARPAPKLVPPPGQLPAATFAVHVNERAPAPGIVQSLDFRSGPLPPGGLYAFEQKQRLGNPYAGQPLVSVDVLPIVRAIVHDIRAARHASAERAARDEVRRELAAFCAVQGCTPPDRR